MIHSRVVGTCSAQLPRTVSHVISVLENKDERQKLIRRTPLRPYEVEERMLNQGNSEKVLKRMAVEVQAQLLADTSIAQLQIGCHSMGEIKDDLGSLFEEMSRQRAHLRSSPISRAGMPRTTFTELGCLVAAN